jgi:hypothetical protein
LVAVNCIAEAGSPHQECWTALSGMFDRMNCLMIIFTGVFVQDLLILDTVC